MKAKITLTVDEHGRVITAITGTSSDFEIIGILRIALLNAESLSIEKQYIDSDRADI